MKCSHLNKTPLKVAQPFHCKQLQIPRATNMPPSTLNGDFITPLFLHYVLGFKILSYLIAADTFRPGKRLSRCFASIPVSWSGLPKPHQLFWFSTSIFPHNSISDALTFGCSLSRLRIQLRRRKTLENGRVWILESKKCSIDFIAKNY